MSGKTTNDKSIPLTHVALYKHGIGYFERRGKFTGPGEIELMCGPADIDDMLKSLLVLRSDGRPISAVTYDSSKTLETRLSEFGFDLRRCSGLIELLASLKGAPVTVEVSGETLSGRVTGLDKVDHVVGETKVSEFQLVLYTDEKTLRRVAVSTIRQLHVNDAALAEEIQQQLELLFQSVRKKDQKVLKVQVEEEGEHNLTIAYSIPCPIWKTSYRLVVTNDDQLILQGSAIVDNTHEDDWQDVFMTLVSAAPISFIQPLYDPVQPDRPVIGAQGIMSSNPFVAERAHAAAAPRPGAPPAPMAPMAFAETGSWGSAPGGAGGQVMGRLQAQGVMRSMKMEDVASTITQAHLAIETESTGELFEYRIANPVSVPRNSSALITIVQQTIEGERISLYNETRHQKFPFAAIRLKNTTGLTLESGPVTVMESSAYAGEALLDVVKPDDQRFVAYAMDQSVHVISRRDYSRQPVYRVRCARGYLCFDYKEQDKKTYHIENIGSDKKIVFIEHPINQGRTYVGAEKPVETTEQHYRFRVQLEPKQSVSLAVPEEWDGVMQIMLSNWDSIELPQVDWALKQNYVDKKLITFLKEVTKRREEIVTLVRSEHQLREQLAQYQNDQERARENIRTLGSSSDRYRKAIDEAEDHIMQATAELNKLVKQIAEKKGQFSQFVSEEFTAEIDDKVAVAT